MPDAALRLFTIFLLAAEWRDGRHVPRGCLDTTYRELRAETGYGRSTISSALAWLEQPPPPIGGAYIAREGGEGRPLRIRVLNYDRYQSQDGTTSDDQSQTRTGDQSPTGTTPGDQSRDGTTPADTSPKPGLVESRQDTTSPEPGLVPESPGYTSPKIGLPRTQIRAGSASPHTPPVLRTQDRDNAPLKDSDLQQEGAASGDSPARGGARLAQVVAVNDEQQAIWQAALDYGSHRFAPIPPGHWLRQAPIRASPGRLEVLAARPGRRLPAWLPEALKTVSGRAQAVVLVEEPAEPKS